MRSLFRSLLFVATLAPVAPGSAHDIITSRYDYHNDVLPILRRHCVGCHRSSGLAPFRLDVYAQARPRAVAIKEQVLSRKMPPWFAEESSIRLSEANRLSAREIDILMEWASGGAPIGKPPDADTSDPESVAGDGLGDPDVVVDLPVLALDERSTTRSLSAPVTWSAQESRFLSAWMIENDGSGILRGAELYRGTPTPMRSLGSRVVSDPPLRFPEDSGAELSTQERLFVRLFGVRPWGAPRGRVLAKSSLKLWFAKSTPDRVVEVRLPRPGPLALPKGSHLFAVRPSAPLELVDREGAKRLEIFETPKMWPRTYRFQDGQNVGDSSLRAQVEQPGSWFITLPRDDSNDG